MDMEPNFAISSQLNLPWKPLLKNTANVSSKLGSTI